MIIKGDINGDGRISAEDLTLMKMHILGIIELTGDAFEAADITNDGIVDSVDLAAINMHILGVKIINEVIY